VAVIDARLLRPAAFGLQLDLIKPFFSGQRTYIATDLAQSQLSVAPPCVESQGGYHSASASPFSKLKLFFGLCCFWASVFQGASASKHPLVRLHLASSISSMLSAQLLLDASSGGDRIDNVWRSRISFCAAVGSSTGLGFRRRALILQPVGRGFPTFRTLRHSSSDLLIWSCVLCICAHGICL